VIPAAPTPQDLPTDAAALRALVVAMLAERDVVSTAAEFSPEVAG